MTSEPSLVVRPVRFTDRVEEMRELLELLGLRPRLESERGGWVDLDGSSGLMALHSAAGSATGGLPGESRLSFECSDATDLARRLHAAGFADATVVDEAYGRVLTVTDPLGAEVQVDEVQDDLYGYRRHAPAPSDLGVVPVRFTDRSEDYHRFLAALGLAGEPAPDGYTTYGAPDRGWVGVHREYDPLPIVASAYASVHLTFVAPDIDGVEARLRAAGVELERFDEDFGSFLDLTDPDGQSIQVHPWPPM